MKLELFNSEANKIWKKAAGGSPQEQLSFELSMHKKLLNYFQVGDYYYMIFNVPILDLEFVSNHIKAVLGYHPSEFTMQTLLDIIHAEDQPYFLNFEHKIAGFLLSLPVDKLMKYKMRYDFRVRKKNGDYIRILHQSTTIEHDQNGKIIRTFGVHTDISHLKTEGKPVLSFIGLDDEPSYINVDVNKIFSISDEILSKREKQILLLVMEGKLSKEIGELLYISKQTVDTHRNNILLKTKAKNTSELITKAIKQGWI